MILEDLTDHGTYVEAEFQRKLIEEYGKTFRLGPFVEETLAMILEHHGEWYEEELANYQQELLDKEEYVRGPYGEMFAVEDLKEVVYG